MILSEVDDTHAERGLKEERVGGQSFGRFGPVEGFGRQALEKQESSRTRNTESLAAAWKPDGPEGRIRRRRITSNQRVGDQRGREG